MGCSLDKLKKLEEETGIILPDSPTQNVSADNVAGKKEEHEFPALSLAKTKKIEDLAKWQRIDLYGSHGNWMD